jgi:hypothetical protein
MSEELGSYLQSVPEGEILVAGETESVEHPALG